MDFEFLSEFREKWNPVGRAALAGWLVFYALFCVYQILSRQGVISDLVFVPIHEGGHLLFGWFGRWPGVLGGTVLQLGVPLAVALYFAHLRQIPGTAFCVFFFFQQLLPTGTYMADARAQALQYVTVGEGETTHDWFFVFSRTGLLEHDTAIGGLVRIVGWLGMLGAMVWFAYRGATAKPNRSTSVFQ